MRPCALQMHSREFIYSWLQASVFDVGKYLASVLFRVPVKLATAHVARAVGPER